MTEEEASVRFVIIGCGMVGSRLAADLVVAGHQVAVVDRCRETLAALGEDFPGQTVVGAGIDIDVLRQAGVEQADAVVAVTSGDNANLMAAQVASRIFKVGRVLARVRDPEKAELYRASGFEIMCPTTHNVEMFKQGLLRG